MIGKFNLRGWLVGNDFAYELPSRDGEIYLNDIGKDFFAAALSEKAAPLFDGVQYYCRDEDDKKE